MRKYLNWTWTKSITVFHIQTGLVILFTLFMLSATLGKPHETTTNNGDEFAALVAEREVELALRPFYRCFNAATETLLILERRKSRKNVNFLSASTMHFETLSGEQAVISLDAFECTPSANNTP